MKNNLMKLYKKEFCCGCEACKNICPNEAIIMVRDEEGFLYPQLDEEKCVSCGLCTWVCPMAHSVTHDFESRHYPIVLGVKNKKIDLRRRESSGGFFSILCDYILSQNGVIYGVKWGKGEDNNVQAEYARIKDCHYQELFGSKYVQSLHTNVYNDIMQDLLNEKFVLFCGTPCDNMAIKEFLNIKKCKTERMIFCDLICAGVPSPKVFSAYISFLEEIYGSKIRKLSFRDKSIYGWTRYGTNVEFVNGMRYHVPNLKDFYVAMFNNAYILRPSCYRCKCASMRRTADFTLGDFWGIDKIDQEFFDNIGVSLVMLNTQKATRLFEQLKNKVEWKTYGGSVAVPYNCVLEKPRECPENRDKIFRYLSRGIKKTIQEEWLPWSLIEFVFKRNPDIKAVIELSVNQNWVLQRIKKEWKSTEVLGIYVNLADKNCIVKAGMEEYGEIIDVSLINNRRIDLLRIDLEGLEYSFLKQIEQVISKEKPIILIELMRKWAVKYHFMPNDVLILLKRYHYKCYAVNNKMEVILIDAITEEMEERWFLFAQDIM